jgi:hypothetical protein
VDSPDFEFLNRLFDLGWIYLQTPSTVYFELSNTTNDDKRESLLDMQATFSMPMGPMVPDHGQLGFSVSSSPQDEEDLQKIHGFIWNGKSFFDDRDKAAKGNAAARNRVRDTMIVQTSIRCPTGGLITQDEDLLRASSLIGGNFMNFRIMTISQAQDAALRGVAKMRRIQSLAPDNYRVRDLPDWPE